jgi:mevalonate kinase
MEPAPFKASAPGTLMLMGEHAVLHGHPALVCAVDRRIHVTLQPRDEARALIRSAVANYESDLAVLAEEPRLRFVLAAIRFMRDRLPGGFEMQIDSEFSPAVGLGSSAAVTVAVLAALQAWGGADGGAESLVRAARDVIRGVQGLGSGADAAASVLGGVVYYRAEPLSARRLADEVPLTVIYSGAKEPTARVVKQVEAARVVHPELYDRIFSLMGSCADEGAGCIEAGDWAKLGALMNIHHGLMDAIGVSSERLSEIVWALRRDRNVYGSKISGSGLGDCVVGLGRAGDAEWPGERIDVHASARGLEIA